jgi:4'-phosphopantetheinyl transferase EntD
MVVAIAGWWRVLDEIVPPEVKTAEAFADEPGAALFPQEDAAMASAVATRRREFATGRACARAALAGLGIPAVPIPRDERGAPQWPPGVAGSITHCAGYRAAAAASTRDVISLGIDAEPDRPLPDGVLDEVAIAAERAMLAGLGAGPAGPCWDRLLFSAKECVFKAWFPLANRWLGFQQARIALDREAMTFTAELAVPGPAAGGRRIDHFTGRWLSRDGLLLTAIVLVS